MTVFGVKRFHNFFLFRLFVCKLWYREGSRIAASHCEIESEMHEMESGVVAV